MCVEQPAVVCQECTVADDVPSRAEDCTFSVVVRQWLGDHDCTAQYNCCLPATTDCLRFCRFCLLFFLILYTAPVQCRWRDSVTLISTLLLTYLLTLTAAPGVLGEQGYHVDKTCTSSQWSVGCCCCEHSTSSQRAFSTAGRTVDERRTQLMSGDSVDGLLFLHGLL